MAVAEQISEFQLCDDPWELEELVRAIELQPEHIKREAYRELFSHDLYALLRYGLARRDLIEVEVQDEETGRKWKEPRRPDQIKWLFDRAREYQAAPNGYLDLWAREHYKSTIITNAGLIFRIIQDQNISIGIFSHTKAIARTFLREIKVELEQNPVFPYLWPEIFWENPRKESPKWTENEGIVVKRTENSREATVEGWGLVDGQPTSRHFTHLHYDDVVTLESVTGPEMIKKTTAAFEMSSNLGSEGGTRVIVGTIYHFGDTYMQLIRRNAVKTRIYPCTHDGEENLDDPMNCVLQSPAYLKMKRVDQGPYTFGTQMLLNPKGDGAQTFKPEWLKWITNELSPDEAEEMFRILIVDPANEKRKHNDWTSMWVFGCDSNRNYIQLDHIRDRFGLTERTDAVFQLHEFWKPQLTVYEHYGMQADTAHITAEMEHTNYRFDILEVGGTTPKNDRIKRLQPIFAAGRIYLRRARHYTDYEGTTSNLMERFVEEEYKAFPVMAFDDGLDSMARLEDPDVQAQITWPNRKQKGDIRVVTEAPDRASTRSRRRGSQPGPRVITRR